MMSKSSNGHEVVSKVFQQKGIKNIEKTRTDENISLPVLGPIFNSCWLVMGNGY